MPDKLIVTNWKALKRKYGAGLIRVESALEKLIEADSKRGVSTTLVKLDESSDMRAFDASHVRSLKSPKQHKDAIDSAYVALRPDYLVILGSIDVVPQQLLLNPIEDEDASIPSDLPYACDSAYSRKPERFLGPTRVCGRIVDITGASEPSYLIGQLNTARRWKTRKPPSYRKFFGLTAEVWKQSTRTSLTNIFGTSAGLRTSPPKGPKWGNSQKRRAHFINCHGASIDSNYYGEKSGNFPVAHKSALITGNVSEGTVATAECCYGAELYNPDDEATQTPGIVYAYLDSGCYAFFGSSTIAYGPAEGNGAADLICQFFLKSVLEGASTGRSALQARQQFIDSASSLDPTDLKTLLQFDLMGDPSIHPVEKQSPDFGIPITSKAKALSSHAFSLSVGRSERRKSLAAKGAALSLTALFPAKSKSAKLSTTINRVLRGISEELGQIPASISSFEIKGTSSGKKMKSFQGHALAREEGVYHVVMYAGKSKKTLLPALDQIVLIARESNGNIVSYRKMYRR